MNWLSLKKVHGVLSIAFVFAVSGCNTALPPDVSGTTISNPNAGLQTLTAPEEAAIKQAILSDLKDPASAMFGNRFLARKNPGYETLTVCGTVNSKNSFGGYVGQTPFIGTLLLGTFPGQNGKPAFRAESMGSSEFGSDLIRQQCSKSRLMI